ncbi:FAD-dependent monooxygenase [Streptomyces avicenniae]|uniref:FAD-dependent monooxygenase n=1 Tax=Streptomyces avicenniae TaxID=500153 RepID=UPI00069C8172|nr:FAD-dependent monooxygenase [Streptomyces avicenniae]
MTSSPRSPHTTEVAVVGGGPVGMLLAAELAHYGVAVTVIEQNERTLDVPKAGTLHARTAQSLLRRGYLTGPEPTAELLEAERAQAFHFAGLPGLTITGPAVEGEPIVGRAQGALERLFEHTARRRGATVLRGHRVTALRTGEGAEADVRLTVEACAGGASPRTVVARWVVGADGARSLVREAVGITGEEHAPRTRAVLGLVDLDAPWQAPPGWNVTERGWTVISPGAHGPSRVAAFDFTGPHPDRRTPLTLEELQATVSRIAGRDIPLRNARFLDRFSDFARLADTYREGRVLLAGDAAHVHFPVGGQGLNLGIQDAVNLAWKLALHLRGWPSPWLLDSYTAERRPPAARTIENTRAQLALMTPGTAHDPLRALFAQLLRLPDVSRRLGDMISDQDVRLPGHPAQSPLTGLFLPNLPLVVEGRATSVARLLRPGRLLLLVLGDGGAEDEGRRAIAPWEQVVDVVTAACVAQLPAGVLLVRPDGYLAWADDGGGTRAGLAALETALDGLLGRRAPAGPGVD